MDDPGLPPKPRSLNLLEKLVTEEEERVRGDKRGNSTVSHTIQQHQTPPVHERQDQNGADPEQSSMKDGKQASQDNKGSRHARNRSRSRSSSSERTKRVVKRDRPYSADYKPSHRSNMKNRPGTSKPSSRSRVKRRSRSPVNHSSDTLSSSDSSYRGKGHKHNSGRSDQRKEDSDDFFDSDQDEKRIDSDTFFDSDKDNKEPKTQTSDRKHSEKKSKKHRERSAANGQRRQSCSDSESSDYQRKVSVEDYSYTSSSDSDTENHVKQESKQTVIQMQTKEKPKNKKLLNRKKVKNVQRMPADPDRFLEAKVTQKYLELEDLLHCPFVDPRSHVTREHVYQMELLRNQYQTVSHGQAPSFVLIPRSLPGHLRNKNQRPWSASRIQNVDDEHQTYDQAFGTIRSVMAAENARQTDKLRTDIHATRPSSGKRSVKKKKLEATLKMKESGSETEEPSVSDKALSHGSKSSSNHSTPRLDKVSEHIDHHIKFSKNEKLKQWLKEKNKVYRKKIKEEREKKKEEREKRILEANEKLEKKLDSDKKVKKWMQVKNREIVKQKKKEEAKRREEESQRRKMEVNLPGDSLKIRPQSAPPSGRASDGEQGEVNKEKLEEERLLEEERRQAKAAKEGPHPPQTKFIYKRPVAGKIKFKMQPPLQTTIKASGYEPVRSGTAQRKLGESHEEMDQRVRMSYDDWLKKKAQDDAEKKKQEKAKKDREMAKSDPELNRIVSKQARNRINNLMNSRKRIDTGIKEFDTKLNRSFGGIDHDTDTSDKDQKRPRSAYRLEGDQDCKEPALMVKQIKRPQTAPANRGRVPPPKKSASSPRKAVVPKKVDTIMAEEHTTNAFSLPFPPELGVPKHVAEKQRKIFGEPDQTTHSEAKKLQIQEEQEGTASKPITVEGKKAEVHDIKEGKKEEVKPSPSLPVQKPADAERPVSPVVAAEEPETLIGNKVEHVTAARTSYSNTSSTADGTNTTLLEGQQEAGTGEAPSRFRKNRELPLQRQSSATTEQELKEEWNKFFAVPETKMEVHKEESQFLVAKPAVIENDLNDQPVVTEPEASSGKKPEEIADSVSEDKGMETQDQPSPGLPYHPAEETSPDTKPEEAESSASVPEVIFESSGTVKSGILKESKKYDEAEDEITIGIDAEKTATDISTGDKSKDDDGDLPSPRMEALSPSKKRVSFSEQTTVFESMDSSSSTDTITPEQPVELNASIDGLDAQPDLDDDDQYEKLSFNIGGFQLNPAVIKTDEEITGKSQKPSSTFITDPGETES